MHPYVGEEPRRGIQGRTTGGQMRERRRRHEHTNHERWLVSYADFITLLFAFFVVMFATSQTDKGKAQQVSDSVKRALEGEKMTQVVAAILGAEQAGRTVQTA